MVTFDAIIERFGQKGEKTGWVYIKIPLSIAEKLNPGVKKSYRVKGKLDSLNIKNTAIIPMGGGNFILPINSSIRKATGKNYRDFLKVQISVDKSEILIDKDFMQCLNDDTVALKNFMKFSPSHRIYFSKWIANAKTLNTKTKRITLALNALSNGMDYSEMLRANKKS